MYYVGSRYTEDSVKHIHSPKKKGNPGWTDFPLFFYTAVLLCIN